MISCPHCNNKEIIKAGILKSGKQRYYCKSCKHYFNKSTLLSAFEPLIESCPYCGGPLLKSGHNRNGSQRYRCKKCGKRSTKGIPYSPHKDHGVTCPKCKCSITKKSGFTKDKRQIYICTSCNYKFTLNNKYTHVSKENKKLIAFYGVHLKVPNSDIAKLIGCSDRTIRNVKKEYLQECEKNVINKRKRRRL